MRLRTELWRGIDSLGEGTSVHLDPALLLTPRLPKHTAQTSPRLPMRCLPMMLQNERNVIREFPF